MAEQLYQIGDTNFWVLVDTVAKEILKTYNKTQVEADIAAIQETLERYPDPSVMEEDLQALVSLINSAPVTQERKDRVKAMLQDMWNAYQDEPILFEQAELREKLERLQAILAVMEA